MNKMSRTCSQPRCSMYVLLLVCAKNYCLKALQNEFTSFVLKARRAWEWQIIRIWYYHSRYLSGRVKCWNKENYAIGALAYIIPCAWPCHGVTSAVIVSCGVYARNKGGVTVKKEIEGRIICFTVNDLFQIIDAIHIRSLQLNYGQYSNNIRFIIEDHEILSIHADTFRPQGFGNSRKLI